MGGNLTNNIQDLKIKSDRRRANEHKKHDEGKWKLS